MCVVFYQFLFAVIVYYKKWGVQDISVIKKYIKKVETFVKMFNEILPMDVLDLGYTPKNLWTKCCLDRFVAITVTRFTNDLSKRLLLTNPIIEE